MTAVCALHGPTNVFHRNTDWLQVRLNTAEKASLHVLHQPIRCRRSHRQLQPQFLADVFIVGLKSVDGELAQKGLRVFVVLLVLYV